MSGASGNIRKIYDIVPAAITSNSVFDGSGAPTTAWSTGITTPSNNGSLWLTSVPQAVTDNGRVGISIAVESLDLRVRITPQPTVVGYQHVRMIVFADNECDGTQPTVAELLGDTTGSATTIATGIEMSFLQPAYFGRFHILEDKNWYIYVSSTANSFTEMEGKGLYHESHHDMRSHRVMWDTTDGNAISNARKGHIFVMFFYSTVVTATGGLPTVTSANPPAIHICSRIRYRDS